MNPEEGGKGTRDKEKAKTQHKTLKHGKLHTQRGGGSNEALRRGFPLLEVIKTSK